MQPHNGPDTGSPPEPLRTITADGLAGLWPDAARLDVRSREEHSTAFIPGSLNIPLDELPSHLTDLPGTTLYLLCGSGKRSSQATRMLDRRGYSTVNVTGGITEWYRCGHPVTYASPPADPPRTQRRSALSSALERLRSRLTRSS